MERRRTPMASAVIADLPGQINQAFAWYSTRVPISLDLSGRVALVTGGSQGIGAGIADVLVAGRRHGGHLRPLGGGEPAPGHQPRAVRRTRSRGGRRHGRRPGRRARPARHPGQQRSPYALAATPRRASPRRSSGSTSPRRSSSSKLSRRLPWITDANVMFSLLEAMMGFALRFTRVRPAATGGGMRWPRSDWRTGDHRAESPESPTEAGRIEIVLPDEAADHSGYCIHPAMLEAALAESRCRDTS